MHLIILPWLFYQKEQEKITACGNHVGRKTFQQACVLWQGYSILSNHHVSCEKLQHLAFTLTGLHLQENGILVCIQDVHSVHSAVPNDEIGQSPCVKAGWIWLIVNDQSNLTSILKEHISYHDVVKSRTFSWKTSSVVNNLVYFIYFSDVIKIWIKYYF